MVLSVLPENLVKAHTFAYRQHLAIFSAPHNSLDMRLVAVILGHTYGITERSGTERNGTKRNGPFRS